MIFNNNIIDYITLRLTTSTNNKCNIYVSVIIYIHWLSSKIFRDLLRLVIYSVIHKRVFIPLRNLPTRIIEAVNHSSNSTIAFTRKITARCKIVCKCFFFLSFFLSFFSFGCFYLPVLGSGGGDKTYKIEPPDPITLSK